LTDVNASGVVNVTDQGQTKNTVAAATPVASAPRFDFNLSGGINVTDQGFVKSQVALSPPRQVLCP
jgi:hypothetical protein